ncbi:MAG: TniQ family protein [Betaproteobacteria bacterium]|nr:TniQ family protein [Betaproteobacteria bacterium]
MLLRNADTESPLDLAMPEQLPRSRLYALPPADLASERVEGMTSYLVRLARAHAVNPRSLIRKELVKAADDPERLRFVARYTNYLRTIDGIGPHARVFAALMTELTTVSTLRYLTLLPLADLLPHNGAGLLARKPRWCPECQAEMVRDGSDATRPLVWSLDLYRVCHRHRRPMVEACGHCGRPEPFVPTYPDLGHCVHCRASLADLGSPAEHPPATAMAVWVAESLADLVARLPELDGIADRRRFIIFLTAAIAERAGGNQARFCEGIGLPRWATKRWLSQGERPTLPQILAIGYGLGIRPAAMFLPGPARPVPTSRRLPAKVRCRAARPRLDAADRRRLGKTIASVANDPADTRSLAELAKEVGLTRSCLKYWFPDECVAIRRKHADACRRANAARAQIDRDKVAEVVCAMVTQGVYPGRRKVNEVLRRHSASLAGPDLMETYRRAVKESLKGITSR